MKIARTLGGIALSIYLPTTLLASPAVTVGQFVQRIAAARGIPATDAAAAADSLEAIGVRLPSDVVLAKGLTRGDVVAIARAIGLDVTTEAPGAPFGAAEVERFLATFSGEITSRAAGGTGPGNGQGGPPFDPFSKAKGKGSSKAKFNRTPSGE